jgi:hypothetical protein
MKTLVIVLCQGRMLEKTFHSLQDNVCKPLNADLAFVGSSQNMQELSVINNYFKHVFNTNEPSSWLNQIDSIHSSKSWRSIADVSPVILGGTGYGQSVGSGAIIMYYREVLRQYLNEINTEEYTWFVITRSDFIWTIPHPCVQNLELDKIYFLDGQRYGGISDRHAIISKNNITKFLDISLPIFTDGHNLANRAKNNSVVNAETLILLRLSELGLLEKCRFLPYMGATIRSLSTSSRWSQGVYSKKLNLYIKYPIELRMSVLLKYLFPYGLPWQKYLAGGVIFRYSLYTFIFKVLVKTSQYKIIDRFINKIFFRLANFK